MGSRVLFSVINRELSPLLSTLLFLHGCTVPDRMILPLESMNTVLISAQKIGCCSH